MLLLVLVSVNHAFQNLCVVTSHHELDQVQDLHYPNRSLTIVVYEVSGCMNSVTIRLLLMIVETGGGGDDADAAEVVGVMMIL